MDAVAPHVLVAGPILIDEQVAQVLKEDLPCARAPHSRPLLGAHEVIRGVDLVGRSSGA